MSNRLPSPFELQAPTGAEGWRDLYPYHLLFSEDRRAREESAFWFHDAIHWPKVIAPWDATLLEYAVASLSQYNTRHFLVPSALGVDARIHHGYAYVSPVAVTDPVTVEARVPEFMKRAGFYYERWDDLYEQWVQKMRALIGQLEAVRFETLPVKEDVTVITSGRGTGSGLDLVTGYHVLIDLALKLWQYHFEFLNLGYAAYLDFFGFCKDALPGISELAIGNMVAGVDIDLLRPDEELRRLARAALELGVDVAFRDGAGPDAVLAELRRTAGGRQWIEHFDAVKEPWFQFSSGSGFYHSDRVWIEHLSIPFGFIGDYVDQLVAGESIERPVDAIRAERERIVSEYRELLGSDEDRQAFDARLRLVRTVFPYVENHNFYVEHWSHSVLWRKMRDLGRVLRDERFIAEIDDVFYFKRNEIPDVLSDYHVSWAVGVQARGPGYWPQELERRKSILAALRRSPPPGALGAPPDVVTEPITIMLWGVTSESVARWLGAGPTSPAEVCGLAASGGVAEGPARVVLSLDELPRVQLGEILVAPLIAPSWTPIFAKVAATVTDVGGTMSHAAIVCREYGLPAVSGTVDATRRIKNGQRLRVDGSAGTVTILD